MSMKEAKLFKNGQSQAVRLPKEYRFAGKAVYIRKLGDVVILLPKRGSWDTLVDACSKFTDEFMATREQDTQERRPPFE